MNNDDKNKKNKPKRDEDDPFDDLPFKLPFNPSDINIDEFIKQFFPNYQSGSFGKMIDDMIKNIMKMYENISPEDVEKFLNQSFVYGMNFGVDQDGKPMFRQFGNVKPPATSFEDSDVREPLIDVFKEKNKVRIIAEVPGIEKGDIKLTGTETTLTIRAHSKNRKYEKVVKLPAKVKSNTAKAKYNNGVLEVVIDTIGEDLDDSIDINVE